MAHLKTQSTQKQPEERLRWKFHLVKRLYETGYSREDLLELLLYRLVSGLTRRAGTIVSGVIKRPIREPRGGYNR